MTEKIKAIALVSGGLDSMLALKLIVDQRIAVKVVHFWTPFFTKSLHDVLNKTGNVTNEPAFQQRHKLTRPFHLI